MTINKYVSTWTALVGAPGYTITYTSSSTTNPAPMSSFWAAVAPYLPTGVVVTVPNNGEVIDEITGKMVGVWNQGTQVATTGTGGTTYAPSNGALVRLNTASFRNGRQVRGHMFLVPLANSAYGTGGVLSAGTANAIQAAAAALVSQWTGSMQVWSRPVYKAAAVPGDPPTLVRGGAISAVTTTVCPTKAATLRSRRDT